MKLYLKYKELLCFSFYQQKYLLIILILYAHDY
jgi:hypothetical protein